MRTSNYLFLLLSIFLKTVICYSQIETAKLYNHKIGIGGWIEADYSHIDASYSFIKKNKNEICMSLHYAITENSINQTILGLEYYFSVFKKQSLFDLFIIGGINIFYDWGSSKYYNEDYWRCGPFAILGINPAFNISKRVSISVEAKIGYGYLWSNKWDYTYQNVRYENTLSEVTGIYYRALKLNYKF
jgi:hypothetical protein